MVKMLTTAVLIIFTFTGCIVNKQIKVKNNDTDLKLISFDWLVGDWKRINNADGEHTYESWLKINDLNYEGHGKTIKNNKVVFNEKMQITKVLRQRYLKVNLPGNDTTTDFVITKIKENGFICENYKNEFPKKIEYNYFPEKDQLIAVISGGDKSVLFQFERMKRSTIRLNITGVPVLDQDKALAFYTTVLGFIEKRNIPVGKYKWLTVVSRQDYDGVELLLEPVGFEETKIYQRSLYEKGIPWTQFNVDDINSEVERLKNMGVVFKMDPTNVGQAIIAIFDDTCGNNIQLIQELKSN